MYKESDDVWLPDNRLRPGSRRALDGFLRDVARADPAIHDEAGNGSGWRSDIRVCQVTLAVFCRGSLEFGISVLRVDEGKEKGVELDLNIGETIKGDPLLSEEVLRGYSNDVRTQGSALLSLRFSLVVEFDGDIRVAKHNWKSS